jgi:hypothetical protein
MNSVILFQINIYGRIFADPFALRRIGGNDSFDFFLKIIFVIKLIKKKLNSFTGRLNECRLMELTFKVKLNVHKFF